MAIQRLARTAARVAWWGRRIGIAPARVNEHREMPATGCAETARREDVVQVTSRDDRGARRHVRARADRVVLEPT